MTQITFGFKDFGFAKIGNIRDVTYAHPSNTAANGLVCTIDLQLQNQGVEEGVKYVCHADDNVETGKYVWETCSKVDPSLISPWLPPPEITVEQKAEFSRRVRDVLLSEIDQIATNPMRWSELSPSDQNAVSQYRNDLRNVPQQATFPRSINWPQVPTAVRKFCSSVVVDDTGMPNVVPTT
jgi:hypothetical protein